MSSALVGPAPPRAMDESPHLAPVTRSRLRDGPALVALATCFAALTALTWRRWGVPEIDAGAELSTADLVKHGAVAYRDVRYYYGPLGLYSLALAFKLLGTSFTTAYAFGLAQAATIVAAFYALARQWLEPLMAALASAMVLAIGFSGTAFNFVLPHTNSATFGLLALLLTLLSLARERVLWAGTMAGLTGLTRPEFYAVAMAALIAYVAVTYRFEGRGRAARAAWRMALPALAIPAAVLGWFAWRAGLSRLVTENLWPVKFIAVGAKTQASWMPFTASSLAGLALRAAIYVGVVAAAVKSAEAWRGAESARRTFGLKRGGGGGPAAANQTGVDPSAGGRDLTRGPRIARITALWPLLAMALTLAMTAGMLRASGVLGGQREAIELEARHLMLGMSWLPALGFAAVALAAVRLMRRGPSPLGGHWPADAALIVVAAALGLRAYNAFTTEGSYAPYYAAPLVLLLAIAQARMAERRAGAWGAGRRAGTWGAERRPGAWGASRRPGAWGASRRPGAWGVAIGALAVLAAGFSAYALGGLYVHENTLVHTPRGTFMTTAAAAPALEGAVRAVDSSTRPGEPILAAPVDGGVYFMADRPPALYELTLLPGLLATPAEERAAVARLRREHVALAVIAARDFSAWGTPRFGIDYAAVLGSYLRGAARSTTTVGTLRNRVGGTNPSHGFTVIRLG